MDINQFLDFLHIGEQLKQITRHSWTSDGTHETVAAHSWRLALMALALENEFKDVDMVHVMKLCLVHDLGEAITSDIPVFEKTDEDEQDEVEAQMKIVKSTHDSFKNELQALFDEINEMKTKEAKIYKCLDKLEVLIQHNEASLDTWIELEKKMQLVYADEECNEFALMKEIREQVRQDSLKKLEEGK